MLWKLIKVKGEGSNNGTLWKLLTGEENIDHNHLLQVHSSSQWGAFVMDKVLAAFSHTVTDETLLLKWISFSPAGINKLLTLLLSLSQVEKPLLSLYWSPKNQVSLSPIVFTIYAHNMDNMTRSHIDLRKHRRRRHARHTWSKSCLPVVLGRMANSSSASMVVTRTFICQRKNWRWDSGGHFLFCVTGQASTSSI